MDALLPRQARKRQSLHEGASPGVPGAIDFQGGQTVLVTYLARPPKPVPPPTKSVPPMLAISNQSGTQVATWSCDVFQKSSGIRLKRVYAIAQGDPMVYHPHTGSWYQGAEFSGGY